MKGKRSFLNSTKVFAGRENEYICSFFLFLPARTRVVCNEKFFTQHLWNISCSSYVKLCVAIRAALQSVLFDPSSQYQTSKERG